MSYFGQGNNGRPILLHRTDVTSDVSEVVIDNVFDTAFDWHYLVGVDVTIDDASVSLRIIRRALSYEISNRIKLINNCKDSDLSFDNNLNIYFICGYL